MCRTASRARDRSKPQRYASELRELLVWMAEGRLHPRVCAVYPLERAADALHDVMNRKVTGKVVLTTGL